MEWVLRILMSFLAVPGPPARTEQELRRLLRTMLLPAVLVDGGDLSASAPLGARALGLSRSRLVPARRGRRAAPGPRLPGAGPGEPEPDGRPGAKPPGSRRRRPPWRC